MTVGTVATDKKIPSAGMSQVIFIAGPEQARCVVGSCIALTLYHPRQRLGALAHIVLPDSGGRDAPPGKFADTAIPFMVEQLAEQGANTAGLVAKICGGASMFGPSGPIQIGIKNIKAVSELVKHLGIPVVGEHVAGSKGRRVTFDSETGNVVIDISGEPCVAL